jgi:hypothetical protein
MQVIYWSTTMQKLLIDIYMVPPNFPFIPLNPETLKNEAHAFNIEVHFC